MVAFGYKAGIGTASRVLPDLGATLGVLVLANFGVQPRPRVGGVPVGRLLGGTGARESGDGSCIAVVATDAPLGPPRADPHRAPLRSRPRADRLRGL